MKQLARELSANKYSRFYRPRTGMGGPALASFFFEMYRAVSHARIFLQNAAKSELLKDITVEAFLDIRYLDARQRLSAEQVKERTKTMPVNEVSRLLQEDFELLASGLDDALMSNADRCYSQILALVNLSAFDFFFFLKKFDPSLIEDNFSIQPHFGTAIGRHLSGQIKDFLEVSWAVDTELDWGPPLRVLKLYKNGVDVINPEEWEALSSSLRELRRSNILELMVRHIEENPSWQFKPSLSAEYVVSNYLKAREKEVRAALDGFTREKKMLQVRELSQDVFGNPDVRRAAHYTPQEGSAFAKLGLDGYLCAESFNYTKAFLLDVFKKEMQSICELLLIRGKWFSMEVSQEISENYHVLIDAAAQIAAFDESLGENGETGSRLQLMLAKSDRDKSQLRYLKATLKNVNEDAEDFVKSSARALSVIGISFEKALEDRERGAGELIINWRELELIRETPLVKDLTLVCKRIRVFLQILQLLSGIESGKAPQKALL
ncbi:MAG: DUF5312 domain-containing protein [Treponema sp.]|nr:DUF5312 domain-containing protein [Treponema sp.]